MRAVIQRVAEASVRVDGEVVGAIGPGLLVYLGVATDDGPRDVQYMVNKIRHVRVFPDDQRKMNLDVVQSGGACLVVSAFTTQGDARRGHRAPGPVRHRARRTANERAGLGRHESRSLGENRTRPTLVQGLTPGCLLLGVGFRAGRLALASGAARADRVVSRVVELDVDRLPLALGWGAKAARLG